MLVKIGIPRALLYYYYFPFWKAFFEALDMEVVVSEETNKGILNKGIKESVSEICVPIKLYIGHAIQLLNKEIDYIFVPRMVSIQSGEYFCPKFMGLPDMLRHGVKGLEGKIITCQIKSDSDDISAPENYYPMAEVLGVTKEQIQVAASVAREQWIGFRMFNKSGFTAVEAMKMIQTNDSLEVLLNNQQSSKPVLRIGLIGYVYNIYDPFLNMNIIEKLRELNVDFITFDMLEEAQLQEKIKDMEKTLFWTFSNKLLGAGLRLFHEPTIDGIIHLTAFGCGPDSFMGKLFEFESDQTGVPFMSIRVDEHTGENHLQTRIEAFVDMLKRKKFIA